MLDREGSSEVPRGRDDTAGDCDFPNDGSLSTANGLHSFSLSDNVEDTIFNGEGDSPRSHGTGHLGPSSSAMGTKLTNMKGRLLSMLTGSSKKRTGPNYTALSNDADADASADVDTEGNSGLEREDSSFVDAASYRQEVKALWGLVWPVSLAFLLQMMVSIVQVAYVGHNESTIVFDAVGLGVSFGNVFGVSVGQGIASASDTLSSQAWGSSNKKVVGVVLQRGLLILGLTTLLFTCIWINAEPMLLAFQQDPQLSKITGQYVFMILPTLPINLALSMLQKYLQTQNIVRPVFAVGIANNIINVILCEIFIARSNLGILGAAIVSNLVWFSALAMVLGYILYSKVYVATWPGFTKAAFLHWDQFLKLGIPGMFQLCIEWWSFEICQFLAGLFGEVQLATEILLLQMAAFAFMIPLGISIASNIRVGNLLGANNPHAARRTSRLSLAIVTTTALFTMMLYLVLRDHLPRAFTTNDEVVKTMSKLMLVLSFFSLADHTQTVGGGILRGCGLQHRGAIYNFLGFYVVGAPVLYLATFHFGLELKGLWIALTVASIIQSMGINSHVLFRINWKKEAARAASRIEESASKAEASSLPHGRGDELDADPEAQELALMGDDGMVTKAVSLEKNNSKGQGANDSDGDSDDDANLLALEKIERVPSTSSDAGGINEDERDLEHVRLPGKVVRSRIVWTLICVLILSATIVGRVTMKERPICFPLPEVNNTVQVCDRFQSLLAGRSCSAVCDDGYVLQGMFSCGVDGALLSVPSCVWANSSTVTAPPHSPATATATTAMSSPPP